eukprot:COSAG04_NODE_24603_length_319_cov_1.104545_1_plen_25_part_10
MQLLKLCYPNIPCGPASRCDAAFAR